MYMCVFFEVLEQGAYLYKSILADLDKLKILFKLKKLSQACFKKSSIYQGESQLILFYPISVFL